jgi:hypothetical protein
MPLANSLMLDFRSIIIPRFVYAEGSDFGNGEIASPDLNIRIEELAQSAIHFTEALSQQRQ